MSFSFTILLAKRLLLGVKYSASPGSLYMCRSGSTRAAGPPGQLQQLRPRQLHPRPGSLTTRRRPRAATLAAGAAAAAAAAEAAGAAAVAGEHPARRSAPRIARPETEGAPATPVPEVTPRQVAGLAGRAGASRTAAATRARAYSTGPYALSSATYSVLALCWRGIYNSEGRYRGSSGSSGYDFCTFRSMSDDQ